MFEVLNKISLSVEVMEWKDQIIEQPTSLRTICCIKCGKAFTMDRGKQFNKLPRLMKCGHSICEPCVRNDLKWLSQVVCPHCKVVSFSNQEPDTVDAFPLSNYVAGCMVSENTFMHLLDKKLLAFAKNETNFSGTVRRKYSPKSKPERKPIPCDECSLPASGFCACCKANFCDVCWTKIHSSAKTLMKHVRTPANSNGLSLTQLKKCEEHEKGDIEFYCGTCSAAICSYCALQSHQRGEHKVITLAERNNEIKSDLDAAARVAQLKYKEMHQSFEMALDIDASLGASESDVIAKLGEKIVSNFARLHGILQVHEDQCLMKLYRRKKERSHRIEVVCSQLRNQLDVVESLLAEYTFAESEPHLKDFSSLLSRLDAVKEMPTVLVHGRPEERNAKLTFDEKLGEQLQFYCSVDLPTTEILDLECSSELPDETIEDDMKDRFELLGVTPRPAPADDPSEEEFKQFLVSHMPFSPKMFRRRKMYTVQVSHLKNPGEFYVVLQSQLPKVEAIEKRAKSVASSGSRLSEPVKKGQIYLSQLESDESKWGRVRISEITKTQVNDECAVVVFFLDYGNTQIIPISSLRRITTDLMQELPLAIKCKLFESVPRDGEWCEDSIAMMRKMIENCTVTLYVIQIHVDCLEVDLSVTYPNRELGRDVTSVRDALFVLELSSFVGISAALASLENQRYVPVLEPSVGERFECVITHSISPSDFFIQRAEDVAYCQELGEKLTQLYDDDTDFIISHPMIGMPCAVRHTESGKWRRGKIIDTCKGLVTVMYIDFGDKETLPADRVMRLWDRFIRKRPLALRCELDGIRPVGIEWDEATISYLEKCVAVENVQIQIGEKPTTGGRLKVFALKTANEKTVCVNSLFVEMAHAVEVKPRSSEPPPPFARNEEDEDTKAQDISKRIKELKPGPASRGKVGIKQETVQPREPRAIITQESLTLSKDEYKFTEEDIAVTMYKVRVDILTVESPEVLYLTFPALKKESRILTDQLKQFYQRLPAVRGREWAPNDPCVVYSSDKCEWYRGIIVSGVKKNRVKVFLKDTGATIEEFVSNLRELDDAFKKFPTCAVRCHLADISPAGKDWPLIATESLRLEFQLHQDVYLAKKGNIDDDSLPVELWVSRVIPSGALDPLQREWVTINRILVEQGLAIPKIMKDMYLRTGMMVNPKDIEHLLPESLKGPPPPKPEWLPPEPLFSDFFTGIPTYVDADGGVYVYNVDQDEGKMEIIRAALTENAEVWESSAEDRENQDWNVGDICIARFHMDNGWHRGTVVRVNENKTYDVLFVDYGNVETCGAQDVSRNVTLQHIPIVARKFYLSLIAPMSEDEGWSPSVIDIIHSMVVDKVCRVDVLKSNSVFNEEEIHRLDNSSITLRIIEEDVEVSVFLIEQGLVRPSSFLDTSPPSARSDSPESSENGDEDDTDSQYPVMALGSEVGGLYIRVAQMASESELYGLLEESQELPEEVAKAMRDYKNLKKAVDSEGDSQPQVESFRSGEPCCCVSPWTNEWLRGEIVPCSDYDDPMTACVFFVDIGKRALVQKQWIRKCKPAWMEVPKMAIRFKIKNKDRMPTLGRSEHLEPTSGCLEEKVLYAHILQSRRGGIRIELLDEPSGGHAVQELAENEVPREE